MPKGFPVSDTDRRVLCPNCILHKTRTPIDRSLLINRQWVGLCQSHYDDLTVAIQVIEKLGLAKEEGSYERR